jgi:hypothetical protein
MIYQGLINLLFSFLDKVAIVNTECEKYRKIVLELQRKGYGITRMAL